MYLELDNACVREHLFPIILLLLIQRRHVKINSSKNN